MAKLTVCKTCGGQVATSAQICPHCGAKQYHGAKVAALVALVAVLILAVVIIITIVQSGGTKPRQVNYSGSTAASTAAPTAKSTPTPPKVNTVGDTLELKNVQATLIGVRNDTGNQNNRPAAGNVFLIFEIEICNNSNEEIVVSSLLSFSVYVDDYAQQFSLEAILADGGRQLDGTVSPGKKSRGIIGVEAPEDWQTAELQFTPDVWSGGTFVFNADRSQAS